jgi:2-polyprenyl-6-methoxyphenol hydroxylase-like FAD-dependent oxidoreductase
MHAAYLAGCDGGRSAVRKLAGIPFPGTEATAYSLLGDVELSDPDSLPFGMTRTATGSVCVIPRPGYVRVVAAAPPRLRTATRRSRSTSCGPPSATPSAGTFAWLTRGG